MLDSIKKVIIQLPILKDLYQQRLQRLRKQEDADRERDVERWKARFKADDQQLLHRLDDQVSIYLFKNSVLSRLIYEGNFEPDEIAFVRKYLKAGDTFIDVGSNIGLFSLVASAIVGPAGKVLGFEPSPTTYKRLQLNTSLAKYPNVEVRNLGLSDKPSTLTLNISGTGYDAWDTFASGGKDKYAESVQVPVSTMDKELKGLDKSKISLVKIDVEGWEKFVLLGAEQFLKQYNPYLLIEFTESNTREAGYEVTEIYDQLVAWGYKWYALKDGQLVESKRKASYPYENLVAKK